MSIVTYLHELEKDQPISNTDVYDTLMVLREVTGEDWQVTEHYIRPTFFSRKKVKRYQLMAPVGPGPDKVLGTNTGIGDQYQIINFHCDESNTSINTVVPADSVIAYMMGYMAGYERRNQ